MHSVSVFFLSYPLSATSYRDLSDSNFIRRHYTKKECSMSTKIITQRNWTQHYAEKDVVYNLGGEIIQSFIPFFSTTSVV